MPKFPARVHPILARKANTAVIIRRGPSKSVCTMLWDRTRDEFKLGQWLRGRIYERRCDLSPDGKGLGDVKVLHDFNDMAFEAIPAPY